MRTTRREALQAGFSSMAYYATMATTPNWIAQSAQAVNEKGGLNDKILVIVQQAGGNDGLNTVVPYADDAYYKARPVLGVPQDKVIQLDDLNGFHPQMPRLAKRYLDKGQIGIVQNVGYENPNYSHFSSMDYYEYGMVPGELPPNAGWMARYFDNACPGLGDKNPLAVTTSGIARVPECFKGIGGYTPPAISNTHNYALYADADEKARLAAIHAVNNVDAAGDDDIDFLQRSVNQTEASVGDLQEAASLPALVKPSLYPADSLGKGLKLISQIIRAGYDTRIFYASQGGYDTHGVQVNTKNPLKVGQHPALLDTFDKAMDAFLKEMEMSGNLDRVLIMTFSEFGRRLKENGHGVRRGTDHGAANSMFVMGGGVNGGIYGGQPDLVNLDRGNLRYNIDFRSVYTKVVEDWLGGDGNAIFKDDVYNGVIRKDQSKIGFLNTGKKARSRA